MGKKYIIEIGRLERLYKAFISAYGKPEITWLSPEVDLTPYTEPDIEQVREEAYDKGLSDAWEAAKKIANMPYNEEEKAFGSGGWAFIVKHTASEAIEKIRQYEQEKKEKEEQIHVGDEVIPHHITADSTPVIVTRKWKDGYNQDAIHTIGYDGRTNCFLEEHVEKTGRHFEIAEILAKMKESANEN